MHARIYFNPRARVGRDKGSRLVQTIITQFQSTRPRGARPRRDWVDLVGRVFQSTRPRGARLDCF